MEPIDRKFVFHAICIEHKHEHSHQDAMVFLAKDKALPETLKFYYQECYRLGAKPEQLEGIRLLIERVERYQVENAEKVKVADIDIPEGAEILLPNDKLKHYNEGSKG
ncbi:MAG: Uncharacterized protein FD156_1199 [Nitrospirae bacterium]|nr:MAG: Uncharacterized protein FD156_1199 [Nitrospirota bacterium]